MVLLDFVCNDICEAVVAINEARLEANGRVLLPAHVRKLLGVGPGDTLLIEPGEYGVRLYTRAQALHELRDVVNRNVKAGASLVDEFLAWKKQDTAAVATKHKRLAGAPRERR